MTPLPTNLDVPHRWSCGRPLQRRVRFWYWKGLELRLQLLEQLGRSKYREGGLSKIRGIPRNETVALRPFGQRMDHSIFIVLPAGIKGGLERLVRRRAVSLHFLRN